MYSTSIGQQGLTEKLALSLEKFALVLYPDVTLSRCLVPEVNRSPRVACILCSTDAFSLPPYSGPWRDEAPDVARGELSGGEAQERFHIRNSIF